MEDFLPALLKSALFSGAGEDDIRGMLGCLGARREKYDRGEFILRAGDAVDSLGLLLSGSALVVEEDFWGERNLMARVEPGDVFAESFACSPGTRLTVGVEAESACGVMWLEVRRIFTACPSACPRHSLVTRNLLSCIAQRNLRLSEKLTHMGRRTTREKLLSYLSAEASRAGSPDFTVPFSRQQLADYLGVERSAMCAQLGRLRDEGVLKFEKERFVLLQPREA